MRAGRPRTRPRSATDPAGPRPMCDSVSPAHASSQPVTSTSSPLGPPARPSAGHATTTSPSASRSAVACDATRRGGARARLPPTPGRQDRDAPRAPPRRSRPRPPPRRRARGREPVPTIPGPTEQTAASTPLRLRPRRARTQPITQSHVAVEARRRRAIATSSRPRAFSSRTVSDSETGSAPPRELDVGDPQPRPEPGAHGRELAVDGAADDRHPAERRRQLGAPPPRAARRPARACTGASSRARPVRRRSPSPRVRFAYSTSKPPEPSSSARACSFTSTSSPTSTVPVSRG